MINHLKNFLDGVSNVLALWPDEDYVRPQRGDCLTDYDYLRTDMGQVAKDMRKALKKQKHGQTDDRKSA
ncbi:MAG: hypothetical protein DM484_15180 [Candidatus Methylumidiphilus alinenensis]|uniref:Uncharacterized protein n=1 Tax=Candidatus Methylumidiphilus alinenensis TaxID=2202197 RepID=A0A2W4R138_9GAMM|nr:MAG: hypothetical protein DM484_15180 [Candidatus Methylumidiphilus alinenensis]